MRGEKGTRRDWKKNARVGGVRREEGGTGTNAREEG